MVLWVGFEDFYLFIDYFEWCIGIVKDNCEIMFFKNFYLLVDVYVLFVMLFLNIYLYLFVRVFNNVNFFIIVYFYVFKVDIFLLKILMYLKIYILISLCIILNSI